MNYSDISPRTSAHADLKLLEKAEINNILGKFGDAKTLPKKKSQTITFRRYSKVDSTPAALQEGVTPVGKSMTATDISCVLRQYGDFIRTTDVIADTHEDPVLNEATDVLAEQAAEMMDKMRAGVLKAGTNAQFTNGTERAHVNTVLSRDFLRTCVRVLKGQEAQPITQLIKAGSAQSTYPIPSAFVAVCHSNLQPDIERIDGFTPVSEYASNMGVIPGEVGAVGEMRFVFDNNLSAWADTGGLKAGAGYTVLSTTGTAADVYPVLIFAKHAYGVVSLAGKTGVETLVSNPKPQAGDELAQKGSVGWKAWSGAVILNDAWMLRIETAAKG